MTRAVIVLFLIGGAVHAATYREPLTTFSVLEFRALRRPDGFVMQDSSGGNLGMRTPLGRGEPGTVVEHVARTFADEDPNGCLAQTVTLYRYRGLGGQTVSTYCVAATLTGTAVRSADSCAGKSASDKEYSTRTVELGFGTEVGRTGPTEYISQASSSVNGAFVTNAFCYEIEWTEPPLVFLP